MIPLAAEVPEENPDAVLAALIFAVSPAAVGGVLLRSMPTPAREIWISAVRNLLDAQMPWIRVPVNVTGERLLGGLDYALTITTGKPVFASGLLAAADQGVVVMAMAERMAASTAAMINAVMDSGVLHVEREGFTHKVPSQFGVIALDEGIDDERVDTGLADRLALFVDPGGLNINSFAAWSGSDIAQARERLSSLEIDDEELQALAECSSALGVDSMRGLLLATRVAVISAALAGRDHVSAKDAATAARLVLAPRATRIPPSPDDSSADQESDVDTVDPEDTEVSSTEPTPSAPPEDLVLAAAKAALPPDLLARLAESSSTRLAMRSGAGRCGQRVRSVQRGRPIGSRQAELHSGDRIDLLATLKAAVPWQRLRGVSDSEVKAKIRLCREDIHVTRFEKRTETTTIFAVDASGSQAAQRLAEVKGAIELLLTECYSRRDEVALIAFRGHCAELVLPATRALARARRLLAALPGGGPTPLASGLESARELARAVARQGRTPAVVVMTDGRANIALDGEPGHERAQADALHAARQLACEGFRTLFVDTSRRPRALARSLADAMSADYVPLPYADARAISETVLRATGGE